MNSMNLKYGNVTERRSLTLSDCHYVKNTILVLIIAYMFSIFWCIVKYSLSFVNIVSQFQSTYWEHLASLQIQFNEFIEFDERITEKLD